MKENSRKSGVLMHVSSLPGDYGIGSFGKEARRFIDVISAAGFKLWQILPHCMTDEYNSPYKSYSAFGANPYFIDLPTLYDKGYISKDELASAKQRSPFLCEFSRLEEERLPLLRRAAKNAANDPSVLKEIESMLERDPELMKAAEFLALKEANGGAPWQKWTAPEPDADTLFTYKFIQYEFYAQWAELKSYANSRGVEIIGDLPIYVAEDSADIWSRQDQFLLDSNGYPTAVAGVPPDYFSKNGQMWGNPLYNYTAMKKDGFSWWKRRVEFMLDQFDGVRIDHFRGLEAYWSIPAGAESAIEGRWVKAPGRELVDAIRDTAGDRLIIAEDLGDITPEVNRLREYSEFPGMRVLQFAFLGDEKSPHLPHNLEANSVLYSGTHDNNTLLGFLWECDAEVRRTMLEYFGCSPEVHLNDACEHIIRSLIGSVAKTVIIPIQDILVYGADTRMNTPGRAEGNWGFRATEEQLKRIDTEKYKRINGIYGR